MTNHKQKLQEQLLAEFDALDKLGRGIGRTVGAGAKAIGSVAGGVAGLGSAIKKGYQAGKQTVGGGGADVTQAGTKTKQTGVMGNLAKNLGNVALDTAAGTGYDYTKGVDKNPTKQAPAGKQAPQAGAQQPQAKTGTDPISQAMNKGGAQDAQKRQKTGGKVAGQTSQSASAQYQRDRRAAKKAGTSAVSKGIDQAKQTKPGQTANKVPGQPSATAKDVGKKAGVTTAKIGGQKVDLNDPKMQNLRAAIEKAAPGVISGVDKLKPADKEKLKKALA